MPESAGTSPATSTLAVSRQWLCTNGIGGFAMDTVAGSLAFRYRGLLVAALTPPLGRHLGAYGVGSLGEIFDAEPPHVPRGCPFQPWTVAETLRAWMELAGGPRRR